MNRKKKVSHAYLALPLVIAALFLLMVGFAGVASSSSYITIHIRPNGSIVPSDAPIETNDNITYIVTDDILGNIVIERSNITLNGNGHTVQNPRYSNGIHLRYVDNVTVANITVTSEAYDIVLDRATNCRIVNSTVAEGMVGIKLDRAENCTILNNTVTGNSYGIKLETAENCLVKDNLITSNDLGVEIYYSSKNVVEHNTIADNSEDGMLIKDSSDNTVIYNTIARSRKHGLYIENSPRNTICNNSFQIDGLCISPYYENPGITIANNTVNGKPLVYLENASEVLIEDAGQVILVNCSNIIIRNSNLSYADIGVELWKVNCIAVVNNTMIGNDWYGIYIVGSISSEVVNTSVMIFNNTIASCYQGIYIYRASSNTIAGNKISDSKDYGIYLLTAPHTTVIENTITHSYYEGIALDYSSDNTVIARNTVTDCLGVGIGAGASQKIYVVNNTLARSGGVGCGGVSFFSVKNSIIAGNTVIDSTYVGIYIATWSSRVDTNITIIDNTISGSTAHGIFLNTASNVTVADNTISGCPETGITSFSSCKQIIFNNTIIEDVDETGVYMAGCTGIGIFSNTIADSKTGIDLRQCEDATIDLNQLTTQVRGVALHSVENAMIAGNSILSEDTGISAASSSNITIAHNNIAGNTSAIYMEDVTHCFVIQNHLTSPEGAGIHLKDSSSNTFTMNTILNSSYGILLNHSTGNIAASNLVANNTVGVNTYNASGNLLYHNNFINNTYQVVVNASTNMWNREYPIGGNYWSDYTGTDEYSGPNQDEPGSDGIGDTPYTIDENNTDHYPLMEPAEIGPPEAFTVTYHLVKGWNLISIPFNEEISVDVFGEDARAYAWNATGEAYYEIELLQPGKGYWLYIPSEREITISSTTILESYQTYSEHGWNLIGATYTPPGSTCQASGDYLYSKAFQWNPEKQLYEAVGLSQLTMGHGYWILVGKANVQITVQTT